MSTHVKVKSCSCQHCKRGRHLYHKTIERKARRTWNSTVHKIATLLDPEDTNLGFTFHGGGYTD